VIEADEVRVFRTRSDQAHLAPENVEQLRQLVELGAPQEPSDSSDAPVVAAGYGKAHPVGADDHGPQLVHPERTPVAPDPGAGVESRTAALDPDRERGDGDDGRAQDQPDAGHPDINDSLGG